MSAGCFGLGGHKPNLMKPTQPNKSYLMNLWLPAIAFVLALGWAMWLDARMDRRDVRIAVDLATRHDRAEIARMQTTIKDLLEGVLVPVCSHPSDEVLWWRDGKSDIAGDTLP